MQKTAVITGASQGVGYVTALALAEEGFDIAALALSDPQRMADLRQAIEGLVRK